MADFGNTGTITVRKNSPAVEVNVTNGEYLSYKLTASGAMPIFVFACTHETRLAASDFEGHPKAVYEWTWSRLTQISADVPNIASDSSEETYVVVMSFATTITYTVLVEHRDRDDNVLATLKDLDFASQTPEDKFSEDLLISAV